MRHEYTLGSLTIKNVPKCSPFRPVEASKASKRTENVPNFRLVQASKASKRAGFGFLTTKKGRKRIQFRLVIVFEVLHYQIGAAPKTYFYRSRSVQTVVELDLSGTNDHTRTKAQKEIPYPLSTSV